MQWLDAAPAILAAALVLIGPGLLLAWSVGTRSFALVALTPLLSVSLIVVAAIVSAFVGMPWSSLAVFLLSLMVSGAAFTVSRWRGRPKANRLVGDYRALYGLLGTLLAAGIIGARLIYVFGRPDSISQTYDNIFHLNAIRYILETHQASSFTVGGMTGIPFYPAGWHAVVSLTSQLAGTSIPVAVNATNLVIGAVVWPASCIFLCQQVLGQSRLASALAGLMSAGFGAFPIMMVDFGVLYPNLLSISLLPALLALGIQLLKLSVAPDFPPALCGVVLLLAAPGVALAHPSTLMAFLAFLAPAVLMVFFGSWRQWRLEWPQSRIRAGSWTSILLAGMLASVVAWLIVRPPAEAAFWPPIQSPLGALAELALNAQMDRPPAVVVSAFVAIGTVLILRKPKLWWAAGMLAMACMLFVAVSSFRPGRVRDFLTAIWYNDSYRLAALVPVAGVLVGTCGAFWVARRMQEVVQDFENRRPVAARGAGSRVRTTRGPVWVGAATVIAIAVLSQLGGVSYSANKARTSYELGVSSPLLTADEMAVLNDMQDLVPKNAVVVANPWNGSALSYALADRTPILFHVLNDNATLNDRILLDRLREAGDDPDVCLAVRALNVTFVLDFGKQEINNGSHPAPGLENLEDTGIVTKLSEHGEAKLFRLDACK
ncbi:DUF6541 family protein [Arthrobacter sp. S39]|uniref:DUF6541 family protein n=1 Tax=Arthrobacter sp. S39 TaxID=2509720 RepID=UPI0010374EB6|nr:DUF6541 family protein [Arthrobacter sp. S39]TAP45600.1 hypothetical protein EYS21_02445 [Arthrobacter sp. S39]